NQIFGNAFTQASGYEALHNMYAKNPAATAILGFSNQITLGAMRALNELGKKVPDDISLISFDEVEGVEFFATPLTVVAQPIAELGRLTTELLFQGIDSGSIKERNLHLLEAELICRKSVRRI